MLVTGLCSISASATNVYEEDVYLNNNVKVTAFVYDNSYVPPSSGITVYSYGAGGNAYGYSIDWKGNLYLYRDGLVKTLPIDTTGSTFDINSTGSTTSNYYRQYSLNCECGNSTYGKVTVSHNGSF